MLGTADDPAPIVFERYFRDDECEFSTRSVPGPTSGRGSQNLGPLDPDCAVTAVGGALISTFLTLDASTGVLFTLKALVIVIMGGVGDIRGTIVAALLLGLLETFVAAGIDVCFTNPGTSEMHFVAALDTYWTNLPCGADEVIELYHAHGTSEQFHSELKTDMDVERLPSGKLCVNKIILLCAMAAYNVLRALGQAVIQRAALAPMRIMVSRWRLKTVLQNLVYCAGKLVRHAGRMELQFGKICPWYAVIRDITASYA